MSPNRRIYMLTQRVGSTIKRAAAFAAALSAATAFMSCQQDVKTPTSPAREAGKLSRSQARVVVGSKRRRPAEDKFVQLANEIPGFAGFYLANHQLVAYVHGSTPAAAASAALSTHIANNDLGIPARARPSSVKILTADYDFQTLSDYRDAVSDNILNGPAGVVSVDLDEAINRVTIGILRSQAAIAKPQVIQQLQRFGVPIAAVNFQIGDGIRLATTGPARGAPMPDTSTYLDAFNPDTLASGMAFSIQNAGHCTVGAIADLSGTRVLVSASHCTKNVYELDYDSVFAWNGSSRARWIGLEHNDPAGSTSCTYLLICWTWRSSDAAAMSFSSGLQLNQRGIMARPASRDSSGLGGTRDTAFNSTNQWLTITDTVPASWLYVGEEVDHIGWASGWHYGTIYATCVDATLYPWPGWVQTYCEDAATMYGYLGDSGGPAFAWDGEAGVKLIGLANAFDCNTYSCGASDGVAMFFSTWSSVLNDIGMLGVATNITVGSPSVTEGFSSGNPYLSWSSVSTTNTSATTEYHIYRSVWDASTYTWSETAYYLGSTTSTSYTDTTLPFTASSYTTSPPAECTYTYAIYFVYAYNSGVTNPSAPQYYVGPANGPDPGQITCP
jgi:hypothetical protein